MALKSNREKVDMLINCFWQNGYLTISRRFGTYLPSPQPVGTYDVDAVGRYKRKFAFGIILDSEDLANESTANKLNFLATRQTRFSNTRVTLFVGVDSENARKARELIASLEVEAKRNIKLVVIGEKDFPKIIPN